MDKTKLETKIQYVDEEIRELERELEYSTLDPDEKEEIEIKISKLEREYDELEKELEKT